MHGYGYCFISEWKKHSNIKHSNISTKLGASQVNIEINSNIAGHSLEVIPCNNSLVLFFENQRHSHPFNE